METFKARRQYHKQGIDASKKVNSARLGRKQKKRVMLFLGLSLNRQCFA